MPAPGNADSHIALPPGTPSGALKTAIANPQSDALNKIFGPAPPPLTRCDKVPAAYTTFAAHSSPLGLAWFGEDNSLLRNTFLVALHGAGHPRIGTGYRLVQFSPADRKPRDLLTGFLTITSSAATVHGRPCGILRIAPDTFLVTDDLLGLIYIVEPVRR